MSYKIYKPCLLRSGEWDIEKCKELCEEAGMLEEWEVVAESLADYIEHGEMLYNHAFHKLIYRAAEKLNAYIYDTGAPFTIKRESSWVARRKRPTLPVSIIPVPYFDPAEFNEPPLEYDRKFEDLFDAIDRACLLNRTLDIRAEDFDMTRDFFRVVDRDGRTVWRGQREF